MTQKAVITRLSGVETTFDASKGAHLITLEFDVPHPDDVYQVVVEYDPTKIIEIAQLKELFEKYKEAISPLSHAVWDESVAYLLAND